MPEREVPGAVAQCIIVRFLTKEGVPPGEIYERLKAQYGDDCMTQARVFITAKSYKEGNCCTVDDPGQ